MARHVPLIRQRTAQRRVALPGLAKARRTLRRLNRKLAAILRDDASAFDRAADEGARIVHRLRG